MYVEFYKNNQTDFDVEFAEVLVEMHIRAKDDGPCTLSLPSYLPCGLKIKKKCVLSRFSIFEIRSKPELFHLIWHGTRSDYS